MKNDKSVTLIVWVPSEKRHKPRRLEVTSDLEGKPLTHGMANQMLRGIYAGMKAKIIDRHQRRYSKDMRSYSGLMQERGGY